MVKIEHSNCCLYTNDDKNIFIIISIETAIRMLYLYHLLFVGVVFFYLSFLNATI